MDDRTEVLRREAEHHDQLARELDPSVPIGMPNHWERDILRAAAPLERKRVLDFGCGDGILGIHALRLGAAHVTGFDISPGMVDLARRRAQAHFPDAETEYVVADGHDTGLPAGSFDLILGKFVLHHLELDEALGEVHRLLAPGGRAVFVETSGLNPVLRAARKLIHAVPTGMAVVGTADEHPLVREDLEKIRAAFPSAQVDFPTLHLATVFNRNVLRYRFAAVNRGAYGLDRLLERRFPRTRRFGYYVRVVVAKP